MHKSQHDPAKADGSLLAGDALLEIDCLLWSLLDVEGLQKARAAFVVERTDHLEVSHVAELVHDLAGLANLPRAKEMDRLVEGEPGAGDG